jgi:hypothetical protein
VPASTIRDLSRQWSNHLASYRRHRNDEHREALVEEAARFTGFHLEDDLNRSEYWAKAPLARRVAVLLYLVDQGIVVRTQCEGNRLFEPVDDAESRASAQPSHLPYMAPILEMIEALRRDRARRERTTSC